MQWLRSSLAIAAAALAVASCDDNGSGPVGLAAPTGLVASQSSLTETKLDWTAVTGAASYFVQRAGAATPTAFTTVKTGIAGTTHTDSGLTTGAVYHYRVAAVAGSDTSDFSTVVSFTAGALVATLSSNITTNRTLYADTVYKLQGYVKVQSGATLTIQPGTTILGDTTVAGSSLWILRGARIEANGTAAAPIVFTSQRAPGSRKPGDWGGIIIVGNGIINRTGTINTEGPAGVAENYGGGANNADNSGTLRYVRIEFAGFDVSGGGGSELNGLSMYAVGSGTTIEYVEVLAGLDDSFEFWGGAVDARYLISYEAGDDHFDWSEGYVGRLQYLIGYQNTRLAPASGTGTASTDPQGIEADGCAGSGCATGFRSTPYSWPVVANMTLVGSGTVETQALGGIGIVLRRGTAAFITNSIIARWKGVAVNVRDNVTDTLLQRDSLVVANVILAENVANYDTTSNFGQASKFTADNHRTAATAASLIASINPATLDWRAAAASAATTGGGTVAIPAGRATSFFGGTMANTTYVGAADAGGVQWWAGWSRYLTN
jgi:hypothetical protein